jgi:hypothetical protein
LRVLRWNASGELFVAVRLTLLNAAAPRSRMSRLSRTAVPLGSVRSQLSAVVAGVSRTQNAWNAAADE